MTTGRLPASRPRTGVAYWAVTIAGLAVLVYANYYLRKELETAGEYLYNFYRYFYPDAAREIFSDSYPKWRLLLPIPSMTGSWSPTTLVMMHYVTDWLSPARAWFLTNAVAIVVSYALSWSVFRSRVFSFTLAICMGFGTQLYYVYPNSGLIAFPLYFCYLQALLLTLYRLVTSETHRVAWGVAFVVALLCTVLAYEAWLDFLVFVWLAAVVFGALLWNRGDRLWLRRLALMTAIMTATGLAYIAIKVTLGYGQQPGMESDVVFNYPVMAPAVEDIVSNLFLNLYMALTNFLPPSFVSSYAFYQLGGDKLVELQNGYHAPFAYLVPMQAMFLWRYYAGVAVTLFVIALGLRLRATWRHPSRDRVAMLTFMLMVAIGGPTHSFIKARPMNSMASQTYHVFVAVLGVSLLISLLAMLAWRHWPRLRATAVVAGVWAVIFYSALARPGMISHQATQSGLGVQVYPNPMAKLMQKLGRTYPVPGGLTLFQLQRYQPGASAAGEEEGPAIAPGPPLVPLPVAAPPLSEWFVANGVTLEPSGRGGTVTGDDTEMGYQLVSPPVSVPQERLLLVRVRGANEVGRVCVGVLSANQESWLVSPEPGRSELAVNTGPNAAVRFVVTNCMSGAARQRTRFSIQDVTYGVVEPAEGESR